MEDLLIIRDNSWKFVDKEAIILAGGFGARLRTVIQGIPKPMSPIGGMPFLEFLLKLLSLFGFSRVILSVGYRHEVISKYFGNSFGDMQLDYCVEETPLGTGGAVAKAMQQTEADDVLAVNGDSILLASLARFYEFHRSQHTPVSIALKAETNFDRYGSVTLDGNRIVRFEEKRHVVEGVFNAGLYWLHSSVKNDLLMFPAPFSLEKEIFEKQIFPLSGCVFHDYFIDIGIPEDYDRAQTELIPAFRKVGEIKNQQFDLFRLRSIQVAHCTIKNHLDSAVFLDRDGVINRKIDGDYVRNLSQFEWLPGAIDAIVRLGKRFRYVIVVTNQQGIGKGLMSAEDVAEIHHNMIRQVKEAGGHIDRIYCCPSLDSDNDPNRKPGIGMGLQAKRDFPDIDFSRSLMIGDSASDMLFAEKLGMSRILIDHGGSIPENATQVCQSLADLPF